MELLLHSESFRSWEVYRTCICSNSDLRLSQTHTWLKKNQILVTVDQHKAGFLDINVRFIFGYFDLNLFMFDAWHFPSEDT